MAVSIVERYGGHPPLGAWLKQHFREQKKMGSTDRKQVSHLCYSYYRLGGAFRRLSTEEKILTGTFLCSSQPNKALEELRPQWNERVTLPVLEKLAFLEESDANGEIIKERIETNGGGVVVKERDAERMEDKTNNIIKGMIGEEEHVFPLADALSPEIDAAAFQLSFFAQPDLFLRLRPGKEEQVKQKLVDALLPFTEVTPACLALPNGSKVESVIRLDDEAVVQDRNSQAVINLYKNVVKGNEPATIWDACAASGGKSLLFHDAYPKAKLTVSDIRESILANLHKRFASAGIHQYKSFIGDLSSPSFTSPGKFDVVICDAPCSGSGTWGRTPEQLHFFRREEIARYSSLQKKIAVNAAKSVRATGCLLYITCSVFREENEAVVEFLKEKTGLQLQSMEYFKGYQERADTLFAALFNSL